MWLELFDRWISPFHKDNTRCYSVCCCTNRLDYFRNIFETAKNKKWVGHPTFYIPLKTISITRSASAYQCLHEDCCSWSLNSPKVHPLHSIMATSFWYTPVKKKSEFLNFSWMKKIPARNHLLLPFMQSLQPVDATAFWDFPTVHGKHWDMFIWSDKEKPLGK